MKQLGLLIVSICLLVIGETSFLINVLEITDKAHTLSRPYNLHRSKRDISPSDEEDDEELEEPCSIGCMKSLEVQLEEAFPQHNLTSLKSYSKDLLEDYNPRDFDAFCNVYKNTSQCLHQCDNRDVTKIFALKVLSPVESMCVTNYDAFKKHLPCINKVGNEVKEKCNNACRDYEEYFSRLLGVGENSTVVLTVHPSELRSLFKGSCLYLRCQMDCSIPATEAACGKEAAGLEKFTISAAFSTVNDLMSLVPNNAFWPKECEALANATR